jgi:hypothetical protein
VPLPELLVDINDLHPGFGRDGGLVFGGAEFEQVGPQLQVIAGGKLRDLMRLECGEQPSDLEIDPVLGG